LIEVDAIDIHVTIEAEDSESVDDRLD